MKKFLASLLLISLFVTGCSNKEKTVVTTSEETSEETSATSEEHRREYLMDNLSRDEAGMIVSDMGYIDVSDMDYDEDRMIYIPTAAYEQVIDSIVSYTLSGGNAAEGNTYIGQTDNAALDEVMLDDDPLDRIGVGYLDVDYDGVAELFILDLEDPLGYRILELYFYDPQYGIHPSIHSGGFSDYYMTPYEWLFEINYNPANGYMAEYYWGLGGIPELCSAYYNVEIDNEVHTCVTAYSSWIGSSDTANLCVSDEGTDPGLMTDFYNSCRYQEADYGTIRPLVRFT